MSSPNANPPPAPRRTFVYVDSFNLYYGCLRDGPYRWLNVAEMASLSMPSHYQIETLRFFTARIIARPQDPDQPVRQQTLFRALQTLPNLTMHYGTFLVKTVRMLLAAPLPDGTRFVDVIRSEEKGSDVNLATYLVTDGYENAYDAAVVVSDDSDLAEAVRIVRQRLRKHVTILSPRGRSQELRQEATRFRQIDPAVLARSQFPPELRDAQGVFYKPASWQRPQN
jgi:uncharacterized LabA/DUF88 family protein